MLRIEIDNFQNDLLLSFVHLRSIADVVLRYVSVSANNVSFYFADISSICDLHEQFFGDPSSTDCISFPAHDLEKIPFRCDFLGEIFVCPHVAVEYSKKHGKDPYEEVMLYVVHGLLHLVGFEHSSSEDALIMENLQSKLVALIISKGLTLDPAKSALTPLRGFR